MTDNAAIYARLRASPLNDWVGGGDPEWVGEISHHHLKSTVDLAACERVLDFGCGIGRAMLPLLRDFPDCAVTGFDIMAPVIDFCRAEIAPHYPNTRFELIAGSNDHYDAKAGNAAGKSREAILAEYGGAFDLAYAFSVFTHVDKGDFSELLRFVGALLRPGGSFYFTAFLLTPQSRAAIAAGTTQIGMVDPRFEDGGSVFVGNAADRLAFIAYDAARMFELVDAAGLILRKVESGAWSGAGGRSYQDVLVAEKPSL